MYMRVYACELGCVTVCVYVQVHVSMSVCLCAACVHMQLWFKNDLHNTKYC